MYQPVRCPSCGRDFLVESRFAGQMATCPACQRSFVIPPAIGGEPGQSTSPVFAPPAALPAGYSPYPVPSASTNHRKLVGIFNLILAIMYLGWGGLMALEAVMFSRGEIPLPPDAPPIEMMVAACAGMAGLSMLTMLTSLVAGLGLLLSQSPRTKTLAIVAAIVQLVSVWGVCMYPFALAAGVYALIALFGQRTSADSWASR